MRYAFSMNPAGSGLVAEFAAVAVAAQQTTAHTDHETTVAARRQTSGVHAPDFQASLVAYSRTVSPSGECST